jgi:hypothetical protein
LKKFATFSFLFWVVDSKWHVVSKKKFSIDVEQIWQLSFDARTHFHGLSFSGILPQKPSRVGRQQTRQMFSALELSCWR